VARMAFLAASRSPGSSPTPKGRGGPGQGLEDRIAAFHHHVFDGGGQGEKSEEG
jgi:hypothetical protein